MPDVRLVSVTYLGAKTRVTGLAWGSVPAPTSSGLGAYVLAPYLVASAPAYLEF